MCNPCCCCVGCSSPPAAAKKQEREPKVLERRWADPAFTGWVATIWIVIYLSIFIGTGVLSGDYIRIGPGASEREVYLQSDTLQTVRLKQCQQYILLQLAHLPAQPET